MSQPQKVNYYVYPGITFQHGDIAEFIMDQVCMFFDITPEQMRAKTRREEIRWPRQICQVLLEKYTKMGMANIANYTGVTNHATVWHAKRRVYWIMEVSKQDRQMFEALEGFVVNAGNNMLTNVLRQVSEYFEVSPVKILNKSPYEDDAYKARCMAIYLMQVAGRLNEARLAIMFNSDTGEIMQALKNRVRFSAKDSEYMSGSIVLRDAIVGKQKIISDEVKI